MELFRQLGLNDSILRAIQESHFKEPTEIQKHAIPIVLQGKDILACAATGSGKTLAFGAGIIQNTVPGQGIQALILTPTRELAEQISTALDKFSRYYDLSILPVYGGVSINPQITSLRNADVVVGTPGRILDHLERRTIDLSKVKIVVLDEADRMLDMGFIDDVNQIIQNCPKQRQTMMFSATLDNDIDYLTRKYTNNAQEISVKSYIDASKLAQSYYDVPNNLKFSLLLHLLKQEKSDLVMVFCATRRNADFVSRHLRENDVNATAIHGGLSQSKRSALLERFHKGKTNVLVCTDVAARGLDIKGVTHVYNYDLPASSDDYVHRIGRTARAGLNGKAISLLSGRDYENFRKILEDENIEITEEKLPYLKKVEIQMSGNRNFRNGSQNRNSRNYSERKSYSRNRRY
ncbi:MAG: DEAD/DEAH box helicase [Candidatus Pacearchaeota archaeon]